MRKPVFQVSEQVRHMPGYTAKEDGKRLVISDLGSRIWSEYKGADQLRSKAACTDDLHLSFRISKKQIFS